MRRSIWMVLGVAALAAALWLATWGMDRANPDAGPDAGAPPAHTGIGKVSQTGRKLNRTPTIRGGDSSGDAATTPPAGDSSSRTSQTTDLSGELPAAEDAARQPAPGKDQDSAATDSVEGVASHSPELVRTFGLGEHAPLEPWDSGSSIADMAICPDGRSLATAQGDGTIRFWDIATGRITRTIKDGNTEYHHPIAYSPDGRHIAAGNSEDMNLFEVESGSRLHVFNNDAEILRIAFGAGLIVTSDRTSSPSVWDVATHDRVRRMDKPQWASMDIHALALSPDGRYVAGGYRGGAFAMWETESGKIVPVFERALEAQRHKQQSSLTVAFSPDGQRIAAGGEPLTVCDIATGEALHRFEDEDGGFCTRFSPNGAFILSSGGGRDSHLKLWDAVSYKLLYDWGAANVRALGFTPDSATAIAAGGGGVIRLWDTATGKRVLPRAEATSEDASAGHVRPVSSVCFSPDGRTLLSTGADNRIVQWNVSTGGVALRISHTARSARFNGVGNRILSRSDNALAVWDALTGAKLASAGLDEGGVFAVAGAFGDARLAVNQYRLAWVYETSPANLVHELHDDVPHSHLVDIALSPDGRYLAGAGFQGTLHVWDVESHQLLIQHGTSFDAGGAKHPMVWGVAFGPSSDDLYVVREGTPLHRWRVSTREIVREYTELTPRGHTALAISPSGALALQRAGSVLLLCDLEAGRVVRELRGHEGGITCFAFDPQGRYAASGGTDKTIKLWDLQSPAPGQAAQDFR